MAFQSCASWQGMDGPTLSHPVTKPSKDTAATVLVLMCSFRFVVIPKAQNSFAVLRE